MKAKIKTLDIQAKKWFDKVNGNSYFSALITVNYGMKTQKVIKIPFQYGYGDQFRYQAFKALQNNKIIPIQENNISYWRYYDEHKIIARHFKIENCLKRDVIAWAAD